MSQSQAHIQPFSAQILVLLSDYLFPPSSAPIPSDYLSPLLLQRHHFLSLSPLNPDYLCWPCPDADRAIDFFHSVQFSPHQLQQIATKAVYSVDAEHIVARVPIDFEDARVQLLFLYDPEDPLVHWKYHDTQLGPLPPNTYSDIEAAHYSFNNRNKASRDMDSLYLDNAEAFWDGYASSESSSPGDNSERRDEADFVQPADDKAEREYWAQYLSVHGSADSTIPSPRNSRLSVFDSKVRLDRIEATYKTANRESPSHREIATLLNGLSDLQLMAPSVDALENLPKHEGDSEEIEATKAALLGIFRMWKIQNPAGDRVQFLALVERAIQ